MFLSLFLCASLGRQTCNRKSNLRLCFWLSLILPLSFSFPLFAEQYFLDFSPTLHILSLILFHPPSNNFMFLCIYIAIYTYIYVYHKKYPADSSCPA